MFSIFHTRAKARALTLVALMSAGLWSILAGAYLAAGSAHAAIEPHLQAPSLSPTTPTQQGDDQALTPTIATKPKAAPETAQPASVEDNHPDRRDLDCLSTAVYYEARGETAAGQAAVAQVVLNRARHPAFPKTVCGVVYQGAAVRSCQFSFVCNGAMRRPREPGAWARARSVAARALGGYVMAQIGQATCFHAARIGPGRGPGVGRITRIGGQVFYGAARSGVAQLWRVHDTVKAPSAPAVATAILVADTGAATADVRPILPSAAASGVDVAARLPASTSSGS